MPTIHIDAGAQTEDLIQYITSELDDATLDQIEIHREVVKSGNLATEPLTAAALLTLATTTVVVVARIIERWLESQKQLEQLAIVAKGFKQSDQAGQALADVSKTFSKVSVAYGMPSAARKGK